MGGCNKYLIGASGVAYLYARDSVNSGLVPTATGWYAQANPNDMDIYHNLPHPTARRFEAGTPNSCGLFAAEAGLELLLATGLHEVASRIQAVTDEVKQAVRDNHWTLVTPPDRHGAILAIKSKDAAALVAKLKEDDVIVSERDGNIRVAPHFYNDAGDVRKLVEALKQNAALLA